MNIYVGNLSFSMTEAQLNEVFSEHGTVDSAKIITDRETGRNRGFGFVEMADPAQADAAIEALNGVEYDGRALTVNESKPREERPSRSGSGGNRRW